MKFGNMSRIGRKPIIIPEGVDFQVSGSLLFAKGPKGELKKAILDKAQVKIVDGKVFVAVQNPMEKEIWGLTRALVNNMIRGVSTGFEKTLEFSGVGYKAQLKGRDLELSLGFTHPVFIKAPADVTFQVEKNTIKISGPDPELVGQAAATIRAARPPEPYKGSGVKYLGEVIQRKAGKKAVTGA